MEFHFDPPEKFLHLILISKVSSSTPLYHHLFSVLFHNFDGLKVCCDDRLEKNSRGEIFLDVKIKEFSKERQFSLWINFHFLFALYDNCVFVSGIVKVRNGKGFDWGFRISSLLSLSRDDVKWFLYATKLASFLYTTAHWAKSKFETFKMLMNMK